MGSPCSVDVFRLGYRPGNSEVQLSRSPVTQERYTTRCRQLVKRYLREGGVSIDAGLWGADPDDFVKWLAARRSELAKSTWGQYRAAVLYILEIYGLAAAHAYLASINRTDSKKRSSATSGAKRKRCPIADLQKLIRWLQALQTMWGPATALWLWASYWTGLRPIEWASAEYVDDHILCDHKPALVVVNAKRTNGRSNGYARLIPLAHLTSEQIDDIRTHLSAIRTAAKSGLYEHMYDNCSRALKAANRACWPRRASSITLTSARHQFTANAKQQLPPSSVAALLGHRSAETAQSTYGRRASAQTGAAGAVPTPVPAQVATVTAPQPATMSKLTPQDRRNP